MYYYYYYYHYANDLADWKKKVGMAFVVLLQEGCIV